MKITALKVRSRNQSRVNVYLDGKFAFELTKIEAARLRVGQTLDEAAIARLQKADEVERAHERALRLLSIRPRSEAEIRRRLREHKVPEAVTEEVLARLRRAGLADDEAFANYWVENRATFRPRSRRALAAELKRKGVAGETLDAAVAEVDEADAAYRAAVQRARRLRGLPYPEFRRRLEGFLARRGFDYETIEPVVERVWKETQSQATQD